MKKWFAGLLLALVLATVGVSAASAQDDVCGYGHTCVWSAYIGRMMFPVHGEHVVHDGTDYMCAATWFQASFWSGRYEIAGVEVWGGQCPGGAVLAFTLADVLHFRWHTGLQSLPNLGLRDMDGPFWLGEPGSSLYIVLP